MNRTLRPLMLGGPVAAVLLALLWLLTDRLLEPARRPVQAASAPTAPADPDEATLRQKLAFARAARLDTLPLGEIIARLGVTFIGTPYKPHVLEVSGPERLVVNLRELDCVTFVENLLALARMVRAGQDDFAAFKAELTRIRYRDGRIDGYPSRLHYFTDWIADNQRKGLLRDLTRELGGVPDREPVNYMSAHPTAYRQLADPANLAAIRRIEAGLSARPRYFIPEDRIAGAAPMIRNGDIIAATSTVGGLDVAHTGIALWRDGQLYLLHAPLVGTAVQISAVPLAERIRRIRTQDGILVVRPL